MALHAPLVETPTSLSQSGSQSGSQSRTPPGPKYYNPLKFFSDFRRDPLQFYMNAARYGNVVRFALGPWSSYAVFHPDHIKYVLQENNHNYGRSIFVSMLKPLLGEGLLTSDGDFWRRQRRLAQPAAVMGETS